MENRNLQKFLGFNNLRTRISGNRRSRKSLVGERAGRAGNHALTARDTSGITHRRVQIESDACGIAFSHAAEHEIILDLVAAANAAVAKNARVVIDGDGE